MKAVRWSIYISSHIKKKYNVNTIKQGFVIKTKILILLQIHDFVKSPAFSGNRFRCNLADFVCVHSMKNFSNVNTYNRYYNKQSIRLFSAPQSCLMEVKKYKTGIRVTAFYKTIPYSNEYVCRI